MFEWIKKHKALFVCLSLSTFISIVGIPFVINLLFKINSNIAIFEAEWSAGDALAYYGSVLSFIGTVVLGALALYQNHILKLEADKRAAFIEEQERIQNMPRFYMRLTSAQGFCGNLKFSVMNVSNNIAYNVEIYDIKIKSGSKTVWETEDTYSSPAINPQKEISIQTKSPSTREKGEFVLFASMTCKDKYDEKHEYVLKMVCCYPNIYDDTSITKIE